MSKKSGEHSGSAGGHECDVELYKLLVSMATDYAASISVGEDGEMTTDWVIGDFTSTTGQVFEMLSTITDDNVHPADREMHTRDVAETMKNKRTVSEFRSMRPDGSVFWVRITRHPIWDESVNRVARYILVAQDITQRKQAELALEESEARYRMLTSLTSDYAASTMVNNDGTMTTEWVVGSFTEITGHQMPVGRPVSLGTTHPDDVEQQRRDIDLTLMNERTTSEIRTIKPDGSIVWLHISRQPVWDENDRRVAKFYSVVQNISVRKLAEEQLRAAELQKAELEAIQKTVGTLAHEINNPLTGIIGALQMAVDGNLKGDEQHKVLAEALLAANNIRKVVDKIQKLREPSYRPYLADREIIDIRED